MKQMNFCTLLTSNLLDTLEQETKITWSRSESAPSDIRNEPNLLLHVNIIPEKESHLSYSNFSDFNVYPDNIMLDRNHFIEHIKHYFPLDAESRCYTDYTLYRYNHIAEAICVYLIDMVNEKWYPQFSGSQNNAFFSWSSDSGTIQIAQEKTSQCLRSDEYVDPQKINSLLDNQLFIDSWKSWKGVKHYITSFRDDYSFLSNMYNYDVLHSISTDRLCRYSFKCTEAAFQAHKTNDPEKIKQFQGLSGPEAKRLGRTLTLPANWEKTKFEIMSKLLLEKFAQQELSKKLLETGNSVLIEGNTWGDTFWGVSNGVGENHLGKILMKVRAYYKKGN